MNRKHLAALLVAFAAVLLIQGALTIRGQLSSLRSSVEAAETEAIGVETQLRTEQQLVLALRQSSKGLIDYLVEWEPFLQQIDSAAAGELNLGARIKGSGIISLAQRYELVNNADNVTIPQMVRAHLTFEDDYARTLNWVGQIEADLPAARISTFKIQRGQTGNDVRVDLVIDLPLVVKGAGA